MPYDLPLGYPATDATGWFALGMLLGFILASVYWFLIAGRAWVRLADLRACYPGWRFERGATGITAHRPGSTRRYAIGGKYTGFQTVCDNMERAIRYEQEHR